MSKLSRIHQKQFGLNGTATDFGVFGSLATGSPVTSKDPSDIQNGAAFMVGWAAETIANNRPALEDFNGLDFLTFYQLCYMFQAGVPEWNSQTTYYQNSFASYGNTIYRSTSDSNLNSYPNSLSGWAAYPEPVNTVSALSGLSDVQFNSLAGNDQLQYNSTSSKWENKKSTPFVTALGNKSGSFALNSVGGVYTAALTANSVLTLPSGLDTSKLHNVVLEFTMNAAYTVTISNVTWNFGATPTLNSAGAINRMSFDTVDGGSTYKGYYSQF